MGNGLKLLAFFIFGAGFFIFNNDISAKDSKNVEVYTVLPKVMKIYDILKFGGFVEAKRAFPISPEVAGTITSINVKLGSNVKKGDTLFIIKPLGAGFDYKTHILKSPISGVITKIFFKVGKLIDQGTDVMVVSDPSRLQTSIEAAYQDLPFIKKNMEADVTVSPKSDLRNSLKAKVLEISPAASEGLGTYQIILSYDCTTIKKYSCKKSFKLGEYVEVTIKKNIRSALTLPISAVDIEDNSAIIVNAKGRIKHITLKLGKIFKDYVEIISGINKGDKVVTKYSHWPAPNEIAIIKTLKASKTKSL